MAALVAVRVRHPKARWRSRCAGCGSPFIIGRYVYSPDGGRTWLHETCVRDWHTGQAVDLAGLELYPAQRLDRVRQTHYSCGRSCPSKWGG
jgi:hypothetical protein